MYFPTSVARQLSTVPALPGLAAEPVITLSASSKKSLFCLLTRNGLTLWRVRPSAVLAHLNRTSASIAEHGENVDMHWSPDGRRIVIQTSRSYLVLVTPVYIPSEVPYRSSANHIDESFLPGAGEAVPLQAVSLRFEGVIKIEGNLISVSPRKDYILFSTRTPPAIQRIPWPAIDDEDLDIDSARARRRRSWTGYDTWMMNEHELPWLLDASVTITKMLGSKGPGIDCWITSDGMVYAAQLQEGSAQHTSSHAHSTEDGEEVDSSVPMDRYDQDTEDRPPGPFWQGLCIYKFDVPRWVQKRRQTDPSDYDSSTLTSTSNSKSDPNSYPEPRRAVAAAMNARFSLVAVGTEGGTVHLVTLPSREGAEAVSQPLGSPMSSFGSLGSRGPRGTSYGTGAVLTMEWSSDGYVLAVGWEHGWAVWSVAGRRLASAFDLEENSLDREKFHDEFMYGVKQMFWTPGNFELMVLAANPSLQPDGQLYAIPFAKSAATSQHAPDNTRYAFLQMDDRVLVYRGADQPDMSVINPESDVWQHIKIPQEYLATNWPIRYSSLSSDGRLVSVAGRRGLVHYSSNSGRWKLFADEVQEQAFTVRGGLIWFHHVLVAAVEVARSYQVRLYSRDLDLSNKNVLHREILDVPVVIMSLVDNSLLVYCTDNVLRHYLIIPTADTIRLHTCGSISFDGVIASPNAVRVLSWMIPASQKQLGDPVEDLSVATVLMMVGGNLVLLKPHRSAINQEVQYDMQILADRLEFCWIHLRGIGALENSLWGYDGTGMRVWLNALAIETATTPGVGSGPSSSTGVGSGQVRASAHIPLDFYPLSALMDKGIIIGAEYEAATRPTLPVVLFRHSTSSHLFLHHILLVHLKEGRIKDAVKLASQYRTLVFFAHALEILLHTVVEADSEPSGSVSASTEPMGVIQEEDEDQEDDEDEDKLLRTVIAFLDFFDNALDVVVRCARKTEMTRWPRLFAVAGDPADLFETCLKTNRLKTAAQYLLVLHTLRPTSEDDAEEAQTRADAATRLLHVAQAAGDARLCRELLQFLRVVDDTGDALRNVMEQTRLISMHDDSIPH